MHFLVGGIYPDQAIFTKKIVALRQRNQHDKCFVSKEEMIMKDIEHVFGMLVKKFHMLSHPIRD